MEKKTPSEWLETAQYAGIVITDPGGWDYRDFESDWGKPITDDEFWVKLCRSTVESRGKVQGPGVVQHPLVRD